MMYNKYHRINYRICFMINMFEDINIDTTFNKFSQTRYYLTTWETKFIENINDIYIWLQIDML